MAKLRGVGRRSRSIKRFMVATPRGLQRQWRAGGLRRPLWIYGGGFSQGFPELSRDPNLWNKGGWRSPVSHNSRFMGQVAAFGQRFFRRLNWLQRRRRFYSLPQLLRQMNFSFSSLARGADVPRIPGVPPVLSPEGHGRPATAGGYPCP